MGDWSTDPGMRFGDGFPSPLAMASKAGNVAVMKLLIKFGAVVDSIEHEGDTPLAIAVSANQRESAVLLLSAGADPTQASVGAALTKCGVEDIKQIVERAADDRKASKVPAGLTGARGNTHD